jgi:hypothetical protein
MDKISTVMDTIEAAGYAQVLVKINKGSPGLARAPAAAAGAGMAAAVAPANSLESYFLLPKRGTEGRTVFSATSRLPAVISSVTASAW